MKSRTPWMGAQLCAVRLRWVHELPFTLFASDCNKIGDNAQKFRDEEPSTGDGMFILSWAQELQLEKHSRMPVEVRKRG
jgi:hypothetical protein